MGSLEDQLKQWKKKADADAPKPASSSPPSRRALKKKPLLQTIRREEPPSSSTPQASPPPKPVTDAELFTAAVEGVSADAVLDKFSAAPVVKVRGQTLQPSAPRTDEELFTEFVGHVRQKGEPTPPPSSKKR
jgi:hypothetical protein